MEEPDAEITEAMKDMEQEKEDTEQDKSDYYGPGRWSPLYNMSSVDDSNPERPHSPQYLDCSLCQKRGSIYVVRGRVQRLILAIGLFLSGRHHDLEVIELTQEEQFIRGRLFRDWRKVSIHVDRMIEVAQKLKEFYVEPNSIGSRIIHSLCERLFIDPEMDFGSMDIAIDFFIETFTGDLDKIRRRGNATLNNFINEKDEYEFYRVVKVKNPEHAQCLLCGRIAHKDNLVVLWHFVEIFSLCIYASPLVSNLMTADQACEASKAFKLFICEEHTHDMAKWLKLFVEKNLHDKKSMKALEDAADIMLYEKSLLKGIQTLHNFIAKHIPLDTRPPQICHYCKKHGPNVYYDELFCLSAHDSCHRENAKSILAKLNCETPADIERLPIELLYPAFDKLVHFLPIVRQRKAEKRQMDTNEMKIFLYVLMVRYYEPKWTCRPVKKIKIDPNLYYGEVPELPRPYAPPTSLPELPQKTVLFEIPDGGYCPTEARPERWQNELLIPEEDLTSVQKEELNRIRQLNKQKKEEREKRRLYKEKLEWLREHSTDEYDHFFTDEYLAKVDKMQAEEKARKLAEQAAGAAQPEHEKMEVDDDQMPSTSESAANVKDSENIPSQSMDTQEPEPFKISDCQTSQTDEGGTSTDALHPGSQSASSSSHSQQIVPKKRDLPKSKSQSPERPSKHKVLLEPEESHQMYKARHTSSDTSKFGSTHAHGSSFPWNGSSTLHLSINISKSESERDIPNIRLEKLRYGLLSVVNSRKPDSSKMTKPGLSNFNVSSVLSNPGTSDSQSREPTHEETSKIQLRESDSSETTKSGLSGSDGKSSNSEPGTSDHQSRKSKHEIAAKLVSRNPEPPVNRLEKAKSTESDSRQSAIFKVPFDPIIQRPSTSAMPPQPSKTQNTAILKHSFSKEPHSSAAKKRGSEDMESGPVAKKSEFSTSGPEPIKPIDTLGPKPNREISTSSAKPNERISTAGTQPIKQNNSYVPKMSNEIRTPGLKPNKEISILGPKPNRMPTSDETKKVESRLAESSRHSVPPSMPSSSDEPHETLAEKIMKSFKIPLITGSRKLAPSDQSFESLFGPGSKPAVNEQSNEKVHYEHAPHQQEQHRIPSDLRARQQSVDRQQSSSSNFPHASRMSMPPSEKSYVSHFSRPDAHHQQKTQPSSSHSRERASSEKPMVVPTRSGPSSSQGIIPPGQQLHRTADQQKQVEQKKQPSQPSFSRAMSVPRVLQTGAVPPHLDSKKREPRPTMPERTPSATTPVKSTSTTHTGLPKAQPGARAHSVSRQSSNLKVLTGLSQSTPSLAPSSATSRKSIPSLMDIDPTARRSIPSLMDTKLAPLRPGTSPTPLGSVRPAPGPIPAAISSLLGPIPPPVVPPFNPGQAPPNYRQGYVPPPAATTLFGAPGLLGAAPGTIQYGEPGLMPPGVTAVQYGATLARQGSRPPHMMKQPWEVKAEPQDTGYPDAQVARNVSGTPQPAPSHRPGHNIGSDSHRRSSAASTSLERQMLLPPPPLPPVLPPVKAPVTAPASSRSSCVSNKVFQMKDIKKELPDDGYNSSRHGNQPSSSSQKVSKEDLRSRQGSQKPTSSQSTAPPRGPLQPRPTPGKESAPTTSRSNPLFQRKPFGKQLTEEEIAANRLRHQGIKTPTSSSSSSAKVQPPTSSASSSSLKRPSNNQRPEDVMKARKADPQASRLTAPPKPPPIPPPLQPARMRAPAEIKQEIYDEMNPPK